MVPDKLKTVHVPLKVLITLSIFESPQNGQNYTIIMVLECRKLIISNTRVDYRTEMVIVYSINLRLD